MNSFVSRQLRDRLGHSGLQLERVYRESSDFRDLCRDYEDCVVVLERLEGQSLIDLKRVEEYRGLRVELETEMLGFLDRHG